MTAGFECHIGGGAVGALTRRTQGMDFGVRFAGALVPALTHDLAVVHQHAADARVGVGGIEAAAREP
jgi:hypothetical protein